MSQTLPPAGNLDFDLATLLPPGTRDADRTGGARVTYSYPIPVVQAEISILDEQRRHAYTIVGQSVSSSVWHSAYLAFRAPTPNTYLETAFFNPQEKDVQVGLGILAGQGWQPIESFTLAPREMRKLRIPATRLATARSSADRTALFRATYSVSATELVANAWLEDETTGFSNTVLFHDVRPTSNRLYGAQMVAYGYPRDLLPDGPTFDGHLVLANIGQEAQTVTPTLHCDLGGKPSTQTLPAFALEPETVRSLPLNQILADQFGHAAEAICSAEIDFTGAPGTLLGRYFGESSSLTYGLYSKLEAGLGHAYNELYWNVEGDRTPLLTVTNFSDTTERIDIWATRDTGSKILRTVELPAKASVHINMQQDFTQRAAELESLRDQAYGGYFIRAENPTARILVKEHIFSLSKQVASPYYGSVDILISHHIQSYPPQMLAGQNATAQTMTCYYSGCYWNGWQISSFQPTIVSTQWLPGWVPRPITAHQPGSATLYSSAQGPINQYGDQGWKDDAVIISVYDATPVINAIVPNTIPAGQTTTVEIWGLNFGTNPSVQAAAGITVGSIVYSSPNQINVVLTHNPGFPPGQYNVWVTSNGFSGSGFLQAPGGGSQAQSGPTQVGVIGATDVSLQPSTLFVSTGDSSRNLTVSVSPSSLPYTVVFSSNRPAQQPVGQECPTSLAIPSVSGSGSTMSTVTASPSGCSGVHEAFATGGGRSSNAVQIVVPPQPLIRVLYREALAFEQSPELDPNGIAQKSIGWCMRNRFGNSTYFAGQNTYQDVMASGQVANSPITHGPNTTLANAASVFLGTALDPTGGSTCFWSPTNTQYQNVLAALASGDVSFPSNIGAPSCFPSSIRQAVIKSGMPNNTQSGSTTAPAFMFLRTRSAGAPAVVQIP